MQDRFQDPRTMTVEQLLNTYTPQELGLGIARSQCENNATAYIREIRGDMQGMDAGEQYRYLRQRFPEQFDGIGNWLRDRNPWNAETETQAVNRVLGQIRHDTRNQCHPR